MTTSKSTTSSSSIKKTKKAVSFPRTKRGLAKRMAMKILRKKQDPDEIDRLSFLIMSRHDPSSEVGALVREFLLGEEDHHPTASAEVEQHCMMKVMMNPIFFSASLELELLQDNDEDEDEDDDEQEDTSEEDDGNEDDNEESCLETEKESSSGE
mmetsp:Transcript_11407/g.26469  ORF Transcript_11407/g.26469 Transcript_11407/m.26469 type:complete len:154 (+) Transcript_11407:116-577(+)|eukprot:CAMPEP_0116845774 /NCGR_PEP_ID=MMETSP0418-20121206/13465_1 /TAXON_ID=1158023 /ORGANISM="Astrosyne radiata, Strain 13vi08-1A" /LENGTH=153 /DNA_ID=CAMNT_0004476945 /DNA_START=369 /DNA_END=830 /DNA_ORIENTATION=+